MHPDLRRYVGAGRRQGTEAWWERIRGRIPPAGPTCQFDLWVHCGQDLTGANALELDAGVTQGQTLAPIDVSDAQAPITSRRSQLRTCGST